MKPVLFAALFGLVAGLSPQTYAAVFDRVVPARSSVEFRYSQMGVKLDGRFARFDARLAFDPARPQDARVEFEVDLASIDTGSPEGDEEAAGRDWFNSGQFPRARFVSRSVRALGGERYQLAGVLTLKGKSREIAVPVTVRHTGNTAVFEGSFSLKRLDFGIGTGPWADTDTVADAVQVRVRLTATGR